MGERLSAERRSSLDHALAGYYDRAPGAHRLPRLLRLPARSRGGRRRHRPPAAALRHRQPAPPALRRGRRPADPRGPGHRLRPAPARNRSFVPPPRWSAPRRYGPPPPRTPVRGCWWWTRCGASCSTRRERPSWSVYGETRGASTGLGLQFITQDVQDLLSEDFSRAITGHSGRALLPERRLQAAASSRTPPPSAPWAKPSTLPVDLATVAAFVSSAVTGCCWRRGNRFPIRIEATPEETEVIEWRPGPSALARNRQTR